jgi:hypothetical protein
VFLRQDFSYILNFLGTQKISPKIGLKSTL